MLKGYQRKLIMLPTRDSSLFETAYFVLKGEAEPRKPSKSEMLCEAMRILEANSMTKKKPSYRICHLVFCFAGGFDVGALSVALAVLFRLP